MHTLPSSFTKNKQKPTIFIVTYCIYVYFWDNYFQRLNCYKDVVYHRKNNFCAHRKRCRRVTSSWIISKEKTAVDDRSSRLQQTHKNYLSFFTSDGFSSFDSCISICLAIAERILCLCEPTDKNRWLMWGNLNHKTKLL